MKKIIFPQTKKNLSAVLLIAAALFLVLQAPGQAAPRPEDAPPGMAFRWTGIFYMAVPTDWKPIVERGEVGFYAGAHPDLLDDPSSEAEGVFLVVTKQKARGGDYRSFIADMEKMAAEDNVKNYSLREEEISLGNRAAVFWSFSGEMETGGRIRKIEGNMIVSKAPEPDGFHIMAVLAGTSSSVDKYRDSIKTILASAREGRPPLEKVASFPFGASDTLFRHSEGPFAAPDGTVAVLDRLNGRMRLFSPQGELLSEWGEKGQGQDGTFNWPNAVAFAPDGSVCVADEGYRVDAHIQLFSRKGEFIAKIKVDQEARQEKGIYYPRFLAVTEEGKIIVTGHTAIRDGKSRVMVLSPSGELLSVWEPGVIKSAALLGGERLVMAFEANDRSDKFVVFDLEGKRLMEWSMWGAGVAPLPGDEKTYFRAEYLSSDGEGRLYVLDDSEKAVWIYSAEGTLLQIVPARSIFGIIEGMAVLPNGDLLVKDRPGGYSPGEPSINLMKNAWPATVAPTPQPKKEAVPQESPVMAAPAEKDEVAPGQAAEESLETDLARLKQALELRREGALLAEEGDLKGAAAKYRESLKFYDDPAVLPYAEGLEKIAALTPAAELSQTAAHAKPEPRPKPTVIPKEPLTVPEQEILAQPVTVQEKPPVKAAAPELPPLPPLEDPRKKAEALWNEAAALQQSFKYEEALELYRKGLTISPDDGVKAHAEKLEAFIPRAKARAEEIWNQAAGLQNAAKYEEALKKYQKGLGIYYNSKVEDHVEKLKAFIARQKK